MCEKSDLGYVTLELDVKIEGYIFKGLSRK